jgi:hypothetical protein
VKPRSRWSDGYGADSVLPEGTPVRGFRPIEAFKAAVRYVRNTSTQAGRNAQIAVIHGPSGERPKAEVDVSTGIDAGTTTRTELAIVK